MRHMFIFLLLMTNAVVLSCRESRHLGPEHLIFQAASEPDLTPTIKQTIYGRVICTTCQPNETSMIIEVWEPDATGTAVPLAQETFKQLGAYEILVHVPHNEPLDLKARLFTNGGVRLVTKRVVSNDDTELSAAMLKVDLVVE